MTKSAVTKPWTTLAARLLLPAVLAWVPLAQAGVVTIDQTESFSLGGATSATLRLNEFDGSLGVLTSIAVSFEASSFQSIMEKVDCENSPSDCSVLVSAASGVSLDPFVSGEIQLSGQDSDTTSLSCRVDAGDVGGCGVRAFSSIIDPALNI